MTSYIVAAITLIGTIGNAYGKAWSFKVWLLTNIYWVLYNLLIKEYAQAVIFGANAVICCIGIQRNQKGR